MGIHAVEEQPMDSIKTYGGVLTTSAYQGIRKLNTELEQSRRIISLDSDQIHFITKEGMACRYQYLHEALWRNEHVVLTNLCSFHFEYRDHAGMLLTESPRNLPFVRTVGYTFCLQICENDIFASQKVEVSNNNDHEYKGQSNQLAFNN